MGKVRINTIGDESAEQKQAAAAKARAAKKEKAEKRKASKKETDGTKETKGTDVSPIVEGQKEVQKPISGNTPEIRGNQKTVKTISTSQKNQSKRSKKYNEVSQKVDKNKTYPLSQAVELLSEVHLAKFDETVELHINTDKTGISGTVTLPHGTGKQVRVAIFAPSKDPKGAEQLMRDIENGVFNFDVLIATPDAMQQVGKMGKVLGPRGLMPNPKNGTVSAKPEEAAKQFAGGQITFKTESKVPVIHMSVGKLSFKKDQLTENIQVAIDAVQSKNIKNITLKSTMSPGIKIQI